MPFAVAFVVSMVFAPGMIAALKRRRVGQTISEDGPESHKPKAGTPTMGGLVILAGILGGALAISWFFGKPENAYLTNRNDALLINLFAVLLLTLAYAALGIADDYLTIHPIRGVRGIASKPKAAVQVLLAIAFVMWLKDHTPGFSDMLDVGSVPILSGWLYWAFSVVFIVGMANFVNITDGLDGLVAGLTSIVAMAFVAIVLLVPPHRGVESATLLGLLSAVAGACVAFLWFNTNPAKVFMGDTGALAIGVALPAIAVVMHREVLMIVVGLVFVLDGLSTAVQWAVFKFTRITTGTGRRVFKKSPIHHHFELSGWPEQTVVVRFWICGVIAALIGFAGAGQGWW
jgi:phospho-N-acetylmuramoyl-pentapeptide-transferase